MITRKAQAEINKARMAVFVVLSSLQVGDPVEVWDGTRTMKGERVTCVLTVQRSLQGSDYRLDTNGFPVPCGSWEHANVQVGYGPGRWNTELTAAGIVYSGGSIKKMEG